LAQIVGQFIEKQFGCNFWPTLYTYTVSDR